MLQTVTFQSVFHAVLRRLGYDPLGDAVKQDVEQGVLQHINEQTRFAWPVWDWPQLNAIEWRAFRTVWTSTQTFTAGTDVYYLGDGVTVPPATVDLPSNYPGPNAGYYQCIQNASPGTLPTNVTFFTAYGLGTNPPLNMALSDRYIDYNQTNQNPIGEILTVYPQNPREVRWSRILRQAPSSKGVDVRTGLDIVWIRYRIPVSQFTLTPSLVGAAGPITFYDPAGGDCWTGTAGGIFPSGFVKIPMPFFLAPFIRCAAYAGMVLETSMEAKIRLAVSQAAQAEALEFLQREIDTLAVQGQHQYYPAFPNRHRHHFRPDVGTGAIPVENFPGFTG